MSHNMFSSYLDGRLQCARIECFLSDVKNVTSGAPQVRLIGPLSCYSWTIFTTKVFIVLIFCSATT